MRKVTSVMVISIGVNFLLALAKILAGWIGTSGALLADGVHSLSDLTTDFFAIIGSKLASRPADLEHPYGHGKFEYITSIGIGLVVLFVGFSVVYSSTQREIVIPSILVTAVSLFTILAKLGLSEFVIRNGRKFNNNILIASGKESRTDVISSVVVLVSSVLMQFSKEISWLQYADIVAMVIVGMFIIGIGFGLLKENVNTILGEQELNQEYRSYLETLIQEHPEIDHVASLKFMKYGHYYCMDATFHMDGGLTLMYAHQLIDEIEKKMVSKYPEIEYFNIHMEPEE